MNHKTTRNTRYTLVLFSLVVCYSKQSILVNGKMGSAEIVLKSINSPKDYLELRQGVNGDFVVETKKKLLFKVHNSGDFEWKVKTNVNFMEVQNGLYHSARIPNKKQVVSTKDWQLVVFEPFESGRSKNWEGDGIMRHCGTKQDIAMHHDCNSKSRGLRKVFKKLPVHTQLKLRLNFHFLDKWEGEQAFIMLDEKVVWAQKRNWCQNIFAQHCMQRGIDVCGNSYPDLVGQLVEFSIHHEATKVAFEVGSSLPLSECRASWAFDDLMIFVR